MKLSLVQRDFIFGVVFDHKLCYFWKFFFSGTWSRFQQQFESFLYSLAKISFSLKKILVQSFDEFGKSHVFPIALPQFSTLVLFLFFQKLVDFVLVALRSFASALHWRKKSLDHRLPVVFMLAFFAKLWYSVILVMPVLSAWKFVHALSLCCQI